MLIRTNRSICVAIFSVRLYFNIKATNLMDFSFVDHSFIIFALQF